MEGKRTRRNDRATVSQERGESPRIHPYISSIPATAIRRRNMDHSARHRKSSTSSLAERDAAETREEDTSTDAGEDQSTKHLRQLLIQSAIHASDCTSPKPWDVVLAPEDVDALDIIRTEMVAWLVSGKFNQALSDRKGTQDKKNRCRQVEFSRNILNLQMEEMEWKHAQAYYQNIRDKEEEHIEERKQMLIQHRSATQSGSYPLPDEHFLAPCFVDGLRLIQEPPRGPSPEEITARVDAVRGKVGRIVEVQRQVLESARHISRFASTPEAQMARNEKIHTLLRALAMVDAKRQSEMMSDAARAARKHLE
ncbi:hypothetical protein FB451DRAFT_1222353 [Mycena latifolia]|nr:hypothetical protein FB451DRAFT_1222353 [Mycena latifolia]